MTPMKVVIFVLGLLLSVSHAAANCPSYNVEYFTKTAAWPAGLNGIVQRFKNGLGGDDNGNTPGPLNQGQRSINWDAAGLPFDMPFDFFNRAPATRGAIFQAKGNEFRVSNTNNASDIDDRFNTIIGNDAARQFQRFSLLRLFTPLLNNVVTVTFRVPALQTLATVSGFAAVFTDVDRKWLTTMSFYNSDGCLIARVIVPPKDRGLSFGGIIVRNWKGNKVSAISKVVIKLGNASFQDFANTKYGRWKLDLVALDDLFYGEPQAIYKAPRNVQPMEQPKKQMSAPPKYY